MIFILRSFMKLKLTQIICLLLILSSCKSLRPVASRNNSSNTTASKKGNIQFLNGINISPGENKSNDYTYHKTHPGSEQSDYDIYSSFNIEKADWLQLKYAILTDMPVEQLNNLSLLQQIDHWWGTRYCLGGSDENCIDCSAFTQAMLYSVYNTEVPRTAKEQYDFSRHINDTDLQEGDLVFFKSGRNISHVGLYVGNYKFVHASTSGGVTISDLNDNYWGKKYAGAGRVVYQGSSKSFSKNAK